jgi:CRP-like cAMP-binding protein
MEQLIDILSTVELFSGLNREQLGRIASISRQETFRTDDTIFRQGSQGDRLYLVAEGQVEIRFNDTRGGDHAVLYLGTGQLFGEMALLDRGARSASVIAVQDGTVVYSITSGDFMALCEADTAIGFVMMRNLALDLSFKLRHKNLDPSTSF